MSLYDKNLETDNIKTSLTNLILKLYRTMGFADKNAKRPQMLNSKKKKPGRKF